MNTKQTSIFTKAISWIGVVFGLIIIIIDLETNQDRGYVFEIVVCIITFFQFVIFQAIAHSMTKKPLPVKNTGMKSTNEPVPEEPLKEFKFICWQEKTINKKLYYIGPIEMLVRDKTEHEAADRCYSMTRKLLREKTNVHIISSDKIQMPKLMLHETLVNQANKEAIMVKYFKNTHK